MDIALLVLTAINLILSGLILFLVWRLQRKSKAIVMEGAPTKVNNVPLESFKPDFNRPVNLKYSKDAVGNDVMEVD